MANLNKVFLMGRLTRDPEVRFTPQGIPVAELGLAVNRVWRDPNGETHEETCFVDVTAWRGQAQTIEKYLRKGSPIFVEGRLHFSSWENQAGEKRSKLRVRMENFQFLDSRTSRPGFDQAGGDPKPQLARQTRPVQQSQQGQQDPSGVTAPPADQANEAWGTYPSEPVDDDLGLGAGNEKENDVPF